MKIQRRSNFPRIVIDLLACLALLVGVGNGSKEAAASPIDLPWEASTLVASNMLLQPEPKLVAGPDNILYAIWDKDFDIFTARSVDGGQIWSSPVRVNDAGLGSGIRQSEPDIALSQDGSRLLAVWRDDREGSSDIYFASSTDKGITWSPNQRVSDAPAGTLQSYPAILADRRSGLDGNRVYVAWSDDRLGSGSAGEIFVRLSPDSGATWGAEQNIHWSASEDSAQYLQFLMGSNGMLYLGFDAVDGGQHRIHLLRSSNFAQSWEVAPLPAPRAGDDAHAFSFAEAGGQLYFAYGYQVDPLGSNNFEVRVTSSGDNGTTWDQPQTVSDPVINTLVEDSFPSLVAQDGPGIFDNLYLAWSDPRGGQRDIFFARSADGGQTWTADQQVNDVNTGTQRFPRLALLNSGRLEAIWADRRFSNWTVFASGHEKFPPPPVSAIIPAATGGSLQSGAYGSTLVIDFPPGAFANDTAVTLLPQAQPSSGTGSLSFAGASFSLSTVGGVQPSHFRITIVYPDPAQMVAEGSLAVYVWNGDQLGWQDVASTCFPASAYQRDPVNNTISVEACHLSEFGLLGTPVGRVFVPLTSR